MNNEPKIYIPGVAKEIPTQYGGIIKLSMPVEDLKKLIDEHAQNGWIIFAISKRKTPGDKGQTHSAWVDKWKPEAGARRRAPTQAQATENVEISGSDVPF